MARHIGTENLKPIRDSERAKELQKKSAEKQRENIAKKKTFREALAILLDEVDPKTGKTNRELMNEAMLAQVKRGNVKAYEVLRDTSGEVVKNVATIDMNVENKELKALSNEELKKLIKKNLE